MDDYYCTNCKHTFKRKHKGWYPNAPCPKCKSTANYKDLVAGGVFVKKYRDVKAFGFDTATGQPQWIDNKGKKIRYDSSEVRYDLFRDPRGWKKTGKI